jgi:hypothetical protein
MEGRRADPWTLYKSAVLAVLRPHKDSLQHDGYIEFGLMYMKHTIEYASSRWEVWQAYWRSWARPTGL